MACIALLVAFLRATRPDAEPAVQASPELLDGASVEPSPEQSSTRRAGANVTDTQRSVWLDGPSKRELAWDVFAPFPAEERASPVPFSTPSDEDWEDQRSGSQ